MQKDNSFLCYSLLLLLFMMTAMIRRRKFHCDSILCKYKLNSFLIQKSCKVKIWEMDVEKGERVTSKFAHYIASDQIYLSFVTLWISSGRVFHVK